jgi:hypothetical protein
MSHITAKLMGFFNDMKTCTKCKIEKDFSEFYSRKISKDNLYPSCKECYKKYCVINKEKISLRNKLWFEKNKEHKIQYDKEYKQKNAQKYIDYRNNNKEKSNKDRQEKRIKDPLYKLTGNLRRRVLHCFKRKFWNKNNTTKDILGCDFEFAKQYLESKFTEGMTWENQGKWHIDHIIPLSSAKTEEELKKLCHYTNLQPLWAIENLKKSNKI